MQTPFPPLVTPPGPRLLYPIKLTPPYDAGKAVRLAATMDAGYVTGGAWYNNFGDFKRKFTHDLPNEFTNPNSDLRSGRFLDKVERFANNPLIDRAAQRDPRAAAAVQTGRQGLRAFRGLTGLGYGGVRPPRNIKGEVGIDAQAMAQRGLERAMGRRDAAAAARNMRFRAAVPDVEMAVPLLVRYQYQYITTFNFSYTLPPPNAGRHASPPDPRSPGSATWLYPPQARRL